MSPTPDAWKSLPLFRTASVLFAAALVFALNWALDRNSGVTVGALHGRLSDLLFLSLLLLLPCAMVLLSTRLRDARGLPRPAASGQVMVWGATFLVALVLMPSFGFYYQRYTDTDDAIHAVRKRFVTEAFAKPWAATDQIEWLQANFSRSYIPGDVYCRMLEQRSLLLFEYRLRNYPGQHSVPVGDTDQPPPDAVLKTIIDNCRREGPAVRQAGRVREAALQAGDVDRFFAMTRDEEDPEREVVLSIEELPPALQARMEAYFASHEQLDNPDRRFTAEMLQEALRAE